VVHYSGKKSGYNGTGTARTSNISFVAKEEGFYSHIIKKHLSLFSVF
jgi:hypothetical protein